MELSRRIETIKQYYDLDALLAEKTDQDAIAKYYRLSDFFYNLIHAQGTHCIHMGLSDNGEYDKANYFKQAEFVDAQIGKNTKRILEIGAGKVANSKYLATKHPEIQFTALDLPHRKFLKTKVPKNITLVEGDFNNLSVFSEKFDLVFGVETVCHSDNKEHTISEISKVLKPGGELILFDVYEAKPRTKMTDFERYVSSVTLAAMRVTDQDQYIGDMKKYLEKHHFEHIEITDLTSAIMPNLKRLERVSGYYFRHPRLLKILKATTSHDVNINSIAGWLMPLSFDGKNIHQYNRIIATKKWILVLLKAPPWRYFYSSGFVVWPVTQVV